VHCVATTTDDPTEQPRWGKVGKQKVVDDGPLPPFADMSNVQNMHDIPFLKAKYDMTTFDEHLVERTKGFIDKAKKDNKPFFVWHNTTRRADSAPRALSAGRARSRPAPSKTESSPHRTGSRPLLLPRGIRTSPTSSSRA
jgi:hypothetical protein